MTIHYIMRVCVFLRHLLKIENDDGATEYMVGYYKNIGLSAKTKDEARSMAVSFIDDGNIDWDESYIKEIDITSFDRQITANCKDRSKTGIWYTSGRILFPNG